MQLNRDSLNTGKKFAFGVAMRYHVREDYAEVSLIMKLRKITTLLSLAVFPVAVTLSGQAPQGGVQAPPPAPAGDVDPAEILEAYGFIVGLQSGLRDFDLDEEEYEIFLKGLNRAQAGEDVPTDIDQILPQLQSYLGARQAEVVQKKGQANREKAAQFFADLQQRDDIESTDEGLFYETVEEGSGERPDTDSMVRIHYEGRLLDGTVFDSSKERGEPAEFPMSGVIPGMAVGLQQMQEGGKANLYIPADLAYGDQSQPTIPPGSALIFEVELIEVMEAPPAEAIPEFAPQAPGQQVPGQP